MKKIALFLMGALAACLLVSCNDTDNDYARYSNFATVHQSVSGYFFEADDHKTFYPADKSRVLSYAPKEGDRVIIYYNLLEDAAQKVPGFDYTIALYNVGTVTWGETAIVADEEALKAEGNGNVVIYSAGSSAYISSTTELMNMAVYYYLKDAAKHKIKLVYVEDYTPDQQADGYLNLELVHDTGNDVTTGMTDVALWMTFDLSEFAEQIAGTKGVIVGMTTLEGKRAAVKIDWLTF